LNSGLHVCKEDARDEGRNGKLIYFSFCGTHGFALANRHSTARATPPFWNGGMVILEIGSYELFAQAIFLITGVSHQLFALFSFQKRFWFSFLWP
jgi:hypothetical protein